MLLERKHRAEILERIRIQFYGVHNSSAITNRGDYTTAFMAKLARIGQDAGYSIYTASHMKLNTPENDAWALDQKVQPSFLFDFCWSIDEQGNDGLTGFQGLPLVCESEWNLNRADIVTDFQKLFVARADIKLMIFQFNSREEYDQIKLACIRSIDESKIDPIENYILFGSGNVGGDDSFVFETIFKK